MHSAILTLIIAKTNIYMCAGPIAAVRVARITSRKGSRLVVNPTGKHLQEADMSILYAGTAEQCTLFELQVCCPWILHFSAAEAPCRACSCLSSPMCQAKMSCNRMFINVQMHERFSVRDGAGKERALTGGAGCCASST